jgi:hypothetical protein
MSHPAPAAPAVDELRRRHPRLVYDSYEYTAGPAGLQARFRLHLEPDVEFTPTLGIPVDLSRAALDDAALDLLVFHLGLVETISYWKASCPPELLVRAGRLDDAQVAWWRDLFLHGLGQFFYENRVDVRRPDLLAIASEGPVHRPFRLARPPAGDVVLAGGGKDSAVALELVAGLGGPATAVVLNPIRAAVDSARIAGHENPMVVRRTIDPALLSLNARGYLNGHTPFSAYLAFLGVLTAALLGHRAAVVANEAGAGEENVTYLGLPVNHQYSKSLRFERAFREYCATRLTPDVEYFSLVRPLHDLQVAALFATEPAHHRSFRSCNVGQKTDSWCGTCPKCAYVYLSLFPFLPGEAMREIFGRDLFEVPAIQDHVRALVGLVGHKPFECVGTREESVMAAALGIRRARRDGRPVPGLLRRLDEELRLSAAGAVDGAVAWFRGAWSGDHFVPSGHLAAVERAFRAVPVP